MERTTLGNIAGQAVLHTCINFHTHGFIVSIRLSNIDRVSVFERFLRRITKTSTETFMKYTHNCQVEQVNLRLNLFVQQTFFP